jgi:O-antigen/teichoic acid export membrane protein
MPNLIGSILGVRIISYWGRNLDNILIGRFFGEAALGVYNRGYRFTDLVSGLFERLFNTVYIPIFRNLKKKAEMFSENIFSL